VSRIFLTLALVANGALVVTLLLGWRIVDPASLEPGARNAVTWHLLTALGAALLVLLVHAVALTYFMGTGRWLEETCDAYRLGSEARDANVRLKYRVIPGMVACITLVVLTGAFGAMADPAANAFKSWASSVHLGLALAMLLANVFVSWVEQRAIARNGGLVDAVVTQVRQIRRERGLDVGREELRVES
jgi:uncharacterized membrane protein